MNTHNIGFDIKLTKIILNLLSNMHQIQALSVLLLFCEANL